MIKQRLVTYRKKKKKKKNQAKPKDYSSKKKKQRLVKKCKQTEIIKIFCGLLEVKNLNDLIFLFL